MLISNIGLPMIFVELPYLALSLLPTILVEAIVYHWKLSIPWRHVWWATIRANLWSTFVGVPIAWLVQLLLQLVAGGGSAWGLETPLRKFVAVTVQSAWLIPYEGQLNWMVAAAAFFLLFPCWVVSVLVERVFLRRYWKEFTIQHLTRTVALANLASYFLLSVYWVVVLIRNI